VKRFVAGSFGSLRLEGDEPQRWQLPSCAEIREQERMAIAGGCSVRDLMESAGAAVLEELVPVLAERPGLVVVLCGPGNNGGDGLVAARLLHQAGYEVVAVVAWAERYSEDFLFQLGQFPLARVVAPFPAALRDCKGQPLEVAENDLPALFARAVVVVDALLGTGQQGAPREAIRDLVDRLQREKAQRPSLLIFSLDIPTGISSDTGASFSPHVAADLTIALEFIKRGCLQFPARIACGEVVAHSIGIPHGKEAEFFCAEGARLPRMKPRAGDVHKGELSRVLVVAGSRSMPGAAALVCCGALHGGAGLVTRVVRRGWGEGMSPLEVIQLVLNGEDEQLTSVDVDVLAPQVSKVDVVVLGPGIGIGATARAFFGAFLEILRASTASVVLDADALTIVAEEGLSLRGLRAIVTPHPGEAGRLLKVSSADIQGDRFASVREIAERYEVVALLKGAGTVVHDGKRGAVIARGTPYLATPGSGDVLAGVIAACTSRAESLFEAAVISAYVHALAGELASEKSGGVITASEVASSVARVVGRL
jgi:NAD(P)H-hydrate epimerase